jgi:transcriptional regulator with XRE-family HTH domain
MSTARPGTALKSLRRSNGWTLVNVSDRTGIPASTLSRIENDQISPTYDLLLKLSKGLSIDVTQLLSMASATPGGAEQPGRRSVNRKQDGEIVPMSSHTLRYLSTDLLNKQITPILCEYRARSLEEFGPLMRHEGEEFLYVIDGELELHTECYAPLILAAGESVYFDSRMGHAYISRSETPCRALSICTVPESAGTVQKAAVPATPRFDVLKSAPAASRPEKATPARTRSVKRRARAPA